MKKISLLLLVLCTLFAFTGCGEDKNNEPVMQDKNFLTDLKKGLDERWKLDTPTSEDAAAIEEGYNKLIESEEKYISKYKDAEFSDLRLGKLSQDYIAALEKQKEAIPLMYEDLLKMNSQWSEGMAERYNVLKILINDYGLELDEKYLEEMSGTAKSVNKEKDIKNKVEEMVLNIEFQEESRNGNYVTYSAVVENTTGITFDFFNINPKLLDSEDIVLSVGHANTNNWQPGEKSKFSFMTDEQFDKIKITIDDVDYMTQQ